MSKKLNVDSYRVVGLTSSHVLVEEGKKVESVVINEKTYKLEYEKTIQLDTSITNRIGFSDEEAINSIEQTGSYGFAMQITTSIATM